MPTKNRTNQIREKPKTAQCVDGGLGRFCFLFAMHIGNQGDVNESEVLVTDAELELSHCLDERCRLNVTDCTTQLNRDKQAFSLDSFRRGHTSTMHTSGSSLVSSTGILDTRSIQSWIALVT